MKKVKFNYLRLDLCIFLLIGLSNSSTLSAQSVSEVQKIVASDKAFGDAFGVSVAVSGDFAIVGASGKQTDAMGGNSLPFAGAAYIYKKDTAGVWYQVQKLAAPYRGAFDAFGISVDISGDYAIVGAEWQDRDSLGTNSLADAGAAYLYKKNGNMNWTLIQQLQPSDRSVDNVFGSSVSISGDYIIVGALGQDYDAMGNNFKNLAGAAYIFEKDGTGNWGETQKIVASDRASEDYFGNSVSISGDYAIVGAKWQDYNAMSGDSLSKAGAAYIFEKDGMGNWIEVKKLVAPNRMQDDEFAKNVSISGDKAVIGAYRQDSDVSGGNLLNNAGAAYIYERDGNGTWDLSQKLVASDRTIGDEFGFSVAISGDYAIVGAEEQSTDATGNNALNNAGAAYLYKKDATGTWVEFQKIVHSDRGGDDLLGSNVAISGEDIIVTAVGQKTDATGNGVFPLGGSAYVYKLQFPVSTQILQIQNTWTIFPNPAQEYIQIKGLMIQQQYMILDAIGRVLQTGTAYPNTPIRINKFNHGTYFIRFENGSVQQFIKQ